MPEGIMVEIIRIKDNAIPQMERACACIGYFDGMHAGHQKLIKKTVNLAHEQGICSALICFSPDPLEVISGRKVSHLFSDAERYRIASSFGIERIIEIRFDELLMNLEAETFIDQYLEKMNLAGLVCGYDFSFGQKGKGNPLLLDRMASFPVYVIGEEKYEGQKISSTRIKEAVRSGDFRLSEQLLGFPYYFIVTVEKASETGEKWLIRCRNEDEYCIVPEDGEYPELFEVKDGKFLIRSDIELKENEIIRIDTR